MHTYAVHTHEWTCVPVLERVCLPGLESASPPCALPDTSALTHMRSWQLLFAPINYVDTCFIFRL